VQENGRLSLRCCGGLPFFLSGRRLAILLPQGFLFYFSLLFSSLAGAVLIIEILRAIIPGWSSWTNRRHFYVVLGVATVFGVFWILVLKYGLSRGYA
jgi:ABC-type Na+ efflux pump permease subunit